MRYAQSLYHWIRTDDLKHPTFRQRKDFNLKRKYILGPYTVVLLRQSIEGPNGSKSNIAAFDSSNKMVWVAQKPFEEFEYYDMQVDEDENIILADSGVGIVYEISVNDGRILNSKLIK